MKLRTAVAPLAALVIVFCILLLATEDTHDDAATTPFTPTETTASVELEEACQAAHLTQNYLTIYTNPDTVITLTEQQDAEATDLLLDFVSQAGNTKLAAPAHEIAQAFFQVTLENVAPWWNQINYTCNTTPTPASLPPN